MSILNFSILNDSCDKYINNKERKSWWSFMPCPWWCSSSSAVHSEVSRSPPALVARANGHKSIPRALCIASALVLERTNETYHAHMEPPSVQGEARTGVWTAVRDFKLNLIYERVKETIFGTLYVPVHTCNVTVTPRALRNVWYVV